MLAAALMCMPFPAQDSLPVAQALPYQDSTAALNCQQVSTRFTLAMHKHSCKQLCWHLHCCLTACTIVQANSDRIHAWFVLVTCALHAGQSTAATDTNGHHSYNSTTSSTSSSRPMRAPPVPGGTTPRHAAHAGDHLQLLDLVEVLITDHRTSLLERKRLQQQLDSAQQALLAERLDKERAAALADMRYV